MQYWYLHFNKCGGTSLQHFLRNQIPERQFGYAERHATEDHTIPISGIFNKKLVHDPYGTLPPRDWIRPVRFAVFRDPLQRAFSDFKMITRWNPADLKLKRQKELFEAAQSGCLEYFSNSNENFCSTTFNAMSCSLIKGAKGHLWMERLVTTYGSYFAIPKDLLIAEALDALNSYTFVFVLERMHETRFLSAAISRGGSEFELDMNLNIHNTSAEFNALPNDTLSLISRLNEIDQIVFTYAKRMEERQNAAEYVQKLVLSDDSAIINGWDAIPLSNISPREINDSKAAFWTTGSATHMLKIKNPYDKHIGIRVTNFIAESQFDAARIIIDDEIMRPEIVVLEDGSRLVSLKIATKENWVGKAVAVTLDVPTMRPAEPTDPRMLGFEITDWSIISSWL